MSHLLVLADDPDQAVIDPSPAWPLLAGAEQRERLILRDSLVYLIGPGPRFRARIGRQAAIMGAGWIAYAGQTGDAAAQRLLADLRAQTVQTHQLRGAFACAFTIGGPTCLLSDPHGQRPLFATENRDLAATDLAALTALCVGPRLALGPAGAHILDGWTGTLDTLVEHVKALSPGTIVCAETPDMALIAAGLARIKRRRAVRILADALHRSLKGAHRPALVWDGSPGAWLLAALAHRFEPHLGLLTEASGAPDLPDERAPDRLILAHGGDLLTGSRSRLAVRQARSLLPITAGRRRPAAAGPLYPPGERRQAVAAALDRCGDLGPVLRRFSDKGPGAALMRAIHGGREERALRAAQIAIAAPLLDAGVVALLSRPRRPKLADLVARLAPGWTLPETVATSRPEPGQPAWPGHPLDRLTRPDRLDPDQRSRRDDVAAFMAATSTQISY